MPLYIHKQRKVKKEFEYLVSMFSEHFNYVPDSRTISTMCLILGPFQICAWL